MKKNTLFILLNSLSKSELKNFKKFLASPFFNVRSDVRLFYDYYLSAEPFLFPEMNKKKLYQKIYGSEPFDDAKLRHLMSYLVKLVKVFYTQVAYRAQPINQQLDLQSKLKQKGLMNTFEKEWIKTKRQLESNPFRNDTYYLQKFELHLQQSDHLFKQKRQGELKGQETIEHLLSHFVIRMLQRSCSILTYQKMSSTKEAFPLLDQVLQMVQTFELEKHPAIAIYYYSVLTLKEPEEERHYKMLKSLLKTYWKIFPLSELKSIHLIAVNYGIQKINSGKPNYVREVFTFYKMGLERGVLLEDGVLSPFTYKNILKLGVRLKEFDWIDQFLDDYRWYLDSKNRKNHYTYCRAVFYFNKPDYDQVLNLLQKVTFKDKLYELDARRMLLIIFYERNEIDALESLLESFRSYIRRQFILGYHKKNYLNLIRFVKKFLKENLSDNKTREKLKVEIEETEALAERQWLLDLLKKR